jgi:hypothetical protein
VRACVCVPYRVINDVECVQHDDVSLAAAATHLLFGLFKVNQNSQKLEAIEKLFYECSPRLAHLMLCAKCA